MSVAAGKESSFTPRAQCHRPVQQPGACRQPLMRGGDNRPRHTIIIEPRIRRTLDYRQVILLPQIGTKRLSPGNVPYTEGDDYFQLVSRVGAVVLKIPLTRFTVPVRRALMLAEEQAIAGHREAIGTGDVLLGLLHEDGGVAARALGSLGITAKAVREELVAINQPEEDGPSSRGISQHITFTRVFMGMMSQALSKEIIRTGHAEEGQKRTPEGNPYLCTGEILLPMVGVPDLRKMGI